MEDIGRIICRKSAVGSVESNLWQGRWNRKIYSERILVSRRTFFQNLRFIKIIQSKALQKINDDVLKFDKKTLYRINWTGG